MNDSRDLPEGFAPVARTSPFADLIGPIYQKTTDDGLRFAIRADARHCNLRGQVHGGVLSTLADIAMGYATAFSTEPPTTLLTVSLSIDYVGKADRGDWIEVRTDVQKVGRRLAFANCYFHVGTARIARASAVFGVPAN